MYIHVETQHFQIYLAAIFFLLDLTVLQLHPSYVDRKASMIRYITLEFSIISTITRTIIIFRLFGWRPSWISSILGHFPCSDFLGLFFTNCRPINELISIGKPFPPILLNLCTLMTGLFREDVIRPVVIHGSLIIREAGIITVFSCTSLLIMSFSLFVNAIKAFVLSCSRYCQLVIFIVFDILALTSSFICLVLIILGLRLVVYLSWPTHFITGKWSDMSKVRVGWVYIWLVVRWNIYVVY